MTDISVIVVNWNTRELLRGCLASVNDGLRPGVTCEVFVVDNASSDGSADMVRESFPHVVLLENAENVGFAAANNQAIARMTGRHALLLNSDCVVQSGAIAAMADFLDGSPGAGACGCRLRNGDGTVQRSAWSAFPTLGSVILGGLWLDKLPVLRGRLARDERQFATADSLVAAAHLLGACLMVRGAAIAQVGALDDGYFMYLEETDWCWRLRSSGWGVWYLPGHSVTHYGQQSAVLALDRATANWCRSLCRFFRRAYGTQGVRLWVLKVSVGVSVVLRFIVLRVRPGGKTRGTWAGVQLALRALRDA